MQDFRRLVVWSRARRLTAMVYRASERWPVRERYGLTAQMRRAAVSVTANIAEGCGRHSDRELAAFLQIAMGSLSELECLLVIARDIAIIDAESHGDLAAPLKELQRMLASLIRRLRALPAH